MNNKDKWFWNGFFNFLEMYINIIICIKYNVFIDKVGFEKFYGII